ncbi:uncharacterized protein LOC144881959 [Branchiostoma floridae x Branchiostoma japonicum]
MYPGGVSGLGTLCSFICCHSSCMAAGIALLLSLVAVGLAPLTFINRQEIVQLSTTVDALKRGQDNGMSTAVDALKRNQDDIRQLSTTVDALKRNQDDIRQLSTTVDALKRNQDDIHQLATTVDALKRDQDDMHQQSTTVDALKRNQDDIRQLSTTVDALKRDQDDMSTTVDALKRDQDDTRQLFTTVDALKRDQDDMSTTVDAFKYDRDEMTNTVDALKRDLDSERSRTAALEQRLDAMINTKSPASCPKRYAVFRGICYDAFDTPKNFSDAAAACGEDGGTLAMSRDAGTNAFLVSYRYHNTVSDGESSWIGLHDRREEGSFEWVDGSALGTYNNWGPGEPNNSGGKEDCISYCVPWTGTWNDAPCDSLLHYICQVVPGRP